MRISSIPTWTRVSKQQQIVFDIIFKQPAHRASFLTIYSLSSDKLPKASKPRISDIIRALRKKDLVAPAAIIGEWEVTKDAIKQLTAISSENAKERAPKSSRKKEGAL